METQFAAGIDRTAPPAKSPLPGEEHGERHRTDPAAACVLARVSRQRCVAPPLLLHASRCTAGIAEARQVAMYLTHVVLRRTYAEIGEFFGRDRTTVAHACARVEDRRDLPDFDAELLRLEAAILAQQGFGGERIHAAV